MCTLFLKKFILDLRKSGMMYKIKDKLNKLPWNKILIIFFSIYIINLQVNVSTFNISNVSMSILKVIRYACYFIFFIRYMQIINIKNWKNLCLILMLVAISICSKDISLFILYIIIMVLKNIKFEKLLIVFFYVSLSVFTVILLSSVIGVIPNWIFFRTKEELRYAFGYQYCTFAPIYFFFIVLVRFCIKKEKIEFSEIMLFFLINIFLYFFTDSRTSFILTTFVIATMYLIKIIFKFNIANKIISNNRIQIFIKYLCYTLPTIIVIISIAMTMIYKYNPNGMKEIDNILSNRLMYTEKSIKKYGISALGTEINWKGLGRIWIHCYRKIRI